MLSFFRQPAPQPQTRFEKCNGLKELVSILKELRGKKDELTIAASKYGFGSVDYRKSCVISTLQTQIDNAINIFNQQQAQPDSIDEMKTIRTLMNSLSTSVSHTLNEHQNLLKIFRNSYHEAANTTTHVGVYVGVCAAINPVTALGAAGAVVSAATVSQIVRSNIGLADEEPKTLQILRHLSNTIEKILASVS